MDAQSQTCYLLPGQISDKSIYRYWKMKMKFEKSQRHINPRIKEKVCNN